MSCNRAADRDSRPERNDRTITERDLGWRRWASHTRPRRHSLTDRQRQAPHESATRPAVPAFDWYSRQRPGSVPGHTAPPWQQGWRAAGTSRSKACSVQMYSTYTTGTPAASSDRCSRRAASSGTTASCVPWNMSVGGQAGFTWWIGDARSYIAAGGFPRLDAQQVPDQLAHGRCGRGLRGGQRSSHHQDVEEVGDLAGLLPIPHLRR